MSYLLLFYHVHYTNQNTCLKQLIMSAQIFLIVERLWCRTSLGGYNNLEYFFYAAKNNS